MKALFLHAKSQSQKEKSWFLKSHCACLRLGLKSNLVCVYVCMYERWRGRTRVEEREREWESERERWDITTFLEECWSSFPPLKPRLALPCLCSHIFSSCLSIATNPAWATFFIPTSWEHTCDIQSIPSWSRFYSLKSLSPQVFNKELLSKEQLLTSPPGLAEGIDQRSKLFFSLLSP